MGGSGKAAMDMYDTKSVEGILSIVVIEHLAWKSQAS